MTGRFGDFAGIPLKKFGDFYGFYIEIIDFHKIVE